jgi:hypothetical protein
LLALCVLKEVAPADLIIAFRYKYSYSQKGHMETIKWTDQRKIAEFVRDLYGLNSVEPVSERVVQIDTLIGGNSAIVIFNKSKADAPPIVVESVGSEYQKFLLAAWAVRHVSFSHLLGYAAETTANESNRRQVAQKQPNRASAALATFALFHDLRIDFQRLPAVFKTRTSIISAGPKRSKTRLAFDGGKAFVIQVNTASHRSFVTLPSTRLGVHTLGNASKAKLATAVYGLTLLVCSLFLAVVPTQCIPASTYLKDLYYWWRYDSIENDSQQINAHATLDTLAQRIRQTSR